MDEKFLDMRVKLDFAREQTVKMESKAVKECQNMRIQVFTMNQTINKLSSELKDKKAPFLQNNTTTFAKTKGLSNIQSTSKSIDTGVVGSILNNNNNNESRSRSVSMDRPHSASTDKNNKNNKINRPATACGNLQIYTDHEPASNSRRNSRISQSSSSKLPSPKISNSPSKYVSLVQQKDPLEKILAKIESKIKPDQSVEKATLLAFYVDN